MSTNSTLKVGRRKTATARVLMKPGNGAIIINKKEAKDYFKTGAFRESEVGREEIKNTLIKHINYCIEDKGEIRANLDMRKHIFWYLKEFENIEKIKNDIIKTKTIKDVLKYIVNNV